MADRKIDYAGSVHYIGETVEAFLTEKGLT